MVYKIYKILLNQNLIGIFTTYTIWERLGVLFLTLKWIKLMANFISFLITCLSCNENDVLFATDVMIQPESLCCLTLNQTIQNKNGRNHLFLYRCFSLH